MTLKTKRNYDQQFKQDAVNLVLSGRSAGQVAHYLGINVSNLNRWKKLYLQEQDRSHNGIGPAPSDLAAENKLLRKQLAEQQEIVTILKKTIKFVS